MAVLGCVVELRSLHGRGDGYLAGRFSCRRGFRWGRGRFEFDVGLDLDPRRLSLGFVHDLRWHRFGFDLRFGRFRLGQLGRPRLGWFSLGFDLRLGRIDQHDYGV